MAEYRDIRTGRHCVFLPRAHCQRAKCLWSGSYFAGPVGGPPTTVLYHCIEQQNHPA